MPDLRLPVRSAPRRGLLSRLVAAPLLCTLVIAGCGGGGDSGATSKGPAPIQPSQPEILPPQVTTLLDKYIEAARTDPGSADKHGTLGLAYEANDLWQEALASFQIAHQLAPTEAMWTLHTAISQLRLGDADGALATLQEGVQAHPDDAVMQDYLGELQLQRGMTASARDAFRAAAGAAPRAAEPLVGLGDVHMTESKPGDAIATLEGAVELDPGYRAAHLLLGMAYREAGREEDGQRELALGEGGKKRYMLDEGTRQLTMLSVTRTSARIDSSRMLAEGKAQEALDLLKPMVERYPEDVRLRVNLALSLQRLGRSEDALAELREAQGIDPQFAMVPYNLAFVCLTLGRNEEAVKHAERALELAGNIAPAHLIRAQALLALGKPKLAAQAAQKAIELDPNQAPAFEILGEVAERIGQAEQAHKSYLHAAQLAENDPRPWPGIFAYAVRTKDVELADRALTALKRLTPEGGDLDAMQAQLDGLRKP